MLCITDGVIACKTENEISANQNQKLTFLLIPKIIVFFQIWVTIESSFNLYIVDESDNTKIVEENNNTKIIFRIFFLTILLL